MNRKKIILFIIIPILLLGTLYIVARQTKMFAFYNLPTCSMDPTFTVNQKIFGSSLPPVKKGDIVSFMAEPIIPNKGQKVFVINGIHDHIPVLVGLKPTCCLSDLIRDAKKSSVEFINSTFNTKRKSGWQEGFGAFSCGFRDRYNVINYILNQKEHRKKITFREEYKQFLSDNEIDYKEEYLFEWFG